MSDKIKNITVLMPVYNDSEFLMNSVNSILNQTYKDFEFLIIDDGSDDEIGKVISSIDDSRINYKKISHKGIAGALNYGLKISSGDLIARIDADDVNPPGRLKSQIDFHNKYPEYDVIAGRSVYFKNKGKILFFIKPPESDNEIKKMLNLHNPINHSSVLFNKKKIMSGGGYNEDFKCYEDFELWFRMRDKLKYKIIPEVLVYTRLRKNSLTKKSDKDQIRELLFKNAVDKEETSKSSDDKKFWNNILFWIEYFYGSREGARNYFTKGITLKKSLAYLNTFLPDKIFTESIEYRLRQKIESAFESKSEYQKELNTLLK